MIRQPAVAGSFYTASPSALAAEVSRYLTTPHPPRPAIGVICPHAGLMFSGHVAGAVLSQVTPPATAILVGPNHTGVGPPISVYSKGAWLIPGGEVQIDEKLAEAILAQCPQAEADTLAHRAEHCLEVQLPFLRHLRTDIRIVPIVVGTTNQDLCQELGRVLAKVIQDSAGQPEGPGPPLLLASTDMSHYEPDDITREKDRHALDAIGHLDAAELDAAVRTHRITMCGFSPTIAFLHSVRQLGARRAALVRYATSGDVTGDRDRVVGYAGFVIT